MIRRWVRDLLTRNRALKLISLALGLLIFLLVRSEKQSLAQGVVPVTYSTPPGKVVVDALPPQLRVGIMGPASRMQRFRFEDLAGVHIDLGTLPQGYLKFSEDMISVPPGLRVVSIRPAGVPVRLEPLSVRSVPVRATVQGQVATGYQVVKRWASPAEVRLTGPSSVVKTISSVATQAVSVEGAETSLVQRVSLMELPPRVNASPATDIKVHVEVAPVTSKVVLSRIPVFFEDSAGRLGQPAPETVDVTVVGPTQLIANLPRDRIAVRPLAESGGKGKQRLKLNVTGLPDGVRVLEVSPPDVLFTARDVRQRPATQARPDAGGDR